MGAFGALLIAFGTSHYFHEYQPRSRDSEVPIPGYTFIEGPTLAELPAAAFARIDGELDLEYAARMTKLVHLSTYHCEPTDHQLSLPGMLVRAAMELVGRSPQFEQGLIRKRSLRCGFCSERAIALSKVLSDHGLGSHAQGLNGHVTSMFTIDGVDYLTDPDYGVGPFSYNSTESELKEIYASSVLPDNAKLVAGIIANRTDDAIYYGEAYLNNLRWLRSFFYQSSSILAAIWISFGVLLSALALPTAYRPRVAK